MLVLLKRWIRLFAKPTRTWMHWSIPHGLIRVDLETSDALDVNLPNSIELRPIKDEHEIAEMRGSVESTIRGFEDIVRAIPQPPNMTASALK